MQLIILFGQKLVMLRVMLVQTEILVPVILVKMHLVDPGRMILVRLSLVH